MKTRPKAWCLPENLQDFAESKWLESHEVLAANATLVPPASHHPEKTMFLKQLPNIKISSGWGRASSPRQIPRWDDLGPARRKSICFFSGWPVSFPGSVSKNSRWFSVAGDARIPHLSIYGLLEGGDKREPGHLQFWQALEVPSCWIQNIRPGLRMVISYYFIFHLV